VRNEVATSYKMPTVGILKAFVMITDSIKMLPRKSIKPGRDLQ
jgi:hypothetical protein